MSERQIDAYIAKRVEWAPILNQLRAILLSLPLTETVKWGGPCYTVEGKNIVGLAAFKHHVALWFHQGALLKDADGVLVNAQEGSTRAMRQWRFRAGEKIPVRRVKAYVNEAIANQQAGKSIKPDRSKSLVVSEPLKSELLKDKNLATAFTALSPGKRREYAEFISEARRDQTRLNRLTKIVPMVMAGIGLNDQYRKGGG